MADTLRRIALCDELLGLLARCDDYTAIDRAIELIEAEKIDAEYELKQFEQWAERN